MDQATRTATARVVLDNPNGLLRPGLFVTAELVEHEAAVPVAVTREAIQNIRGWSAVFVRYGNTFEARPLELGHRDGQWVEVLSGLSAGEQYVAKNSFVLKAEIGKSGAAHAHEALPVNSCSGRRLCRPIRRRRNTEVGRYKTMPQIQVCRCTRRSPDRR